MKQRIITGVLFALVILAFFIPGYFSPYFLCALWTIVAVLSTYEMLQCVRAKKMNPGKTLSYIGAALSLLPLLLKIFTNSPLLAFGIFSLTIIMMALHVVIFLPLIHPGENALADGVATSGIILYVSFPLACANITALFIPNGWYFLAIGVLTPWVSDVFAYFTGSFIGKHKIVPHISPKKTWEGCIGGAIGSAAVMALFFWLFMGRFMDTKFNVTQLILFGAAYGFALSVVSQFGDWLASAIKRWAGIKDFGNILPGHGGILDRFDSAFFSLPAAFALAMLFR
jgi:phosphatidate cytidylyltransferase